jgi:hypothetical protein
MINIIVEIIYSSIRKLYFIYIGTCLLYSNILKRVIGTIIQLVLAYQVPSAKKELKNDFEWISDP